MCAAAAAAAADGDAMGKERGREGEGTERETREGAIRRAAHAADDR